MEPGIGSNHWKLASITEDSLWPKPSQSFNPVSSYHLRKTSGFNGSPAMQQCLMQDRSNWVTSSWSINRYMVGGAQKVVTWYLVIILRRFKGMNLSMS